MENEKQKICAVICEFNPFHSGHAYLINEIKRRFPDHRIIGIMSGDFVQRAEPAIFDKYYRAETALKNGLSAVVQIPTIFSVASAERFAECGIKLAAACNADILAFGCETPSVELLKSIASFQIESSEKFTALFKSSMDSGLSYASALSQATAKALNNNEIIDIMSKPNNILAIEYIKAIEKFSFNIQPIAIPRKGGGYNDTEIESEFPSGMALRKAILNGYDVSRFLSSPIPDIVDYKLFDKIASLYIKLCPIEDIAATPDCAEGLEHKIKKAALGCNNTDAVISIAKSKRYTYARIKRIMVQALLGITREVVGGDFFPSRVLAFRQKDNILSDLKSPIFVKNSEVYNLDSPSYKIDERAALIAAFLLNRDNPLSNKPKII